MKDKMKILVADYDENEREAARLVLGQDYQLCLVDCYNNMRNAMYKDKYDVVLARSSLGEFDGRELRGNNHMEMYDFISSVGRWFGPITDYERIKKPDFFAIIIPYGLGSGDSRNWFNRSIEKNRDFEIIEQIGSDLSYAPKKIYRLDGTIATLFVAREDIPPTYLHKATSATLATSPEKLVRDAPIEVKNWKFALESLLNYNK